MVLRISCVAAVLLIASLVPVPATGGCIEGDCTNGKGTFVWPSGSRYEGQWKNGKRNGHGIFTSAQGETYEGEFKDDKFHGTGTYRFKNGDLYSGQWRNGKQEGHGVHISSDGERFEGTFRDGILVQDFSSDTEEIHDKAIPEEPSVRTEQESSREKIKPVKKPPEKPAQTSEPQERPSRRDHDIVKPPQP